MDKEQLKRLGEDQRFIEGIYNYCDRWCERCPLTSRCMSFALSEEEFADQETRDITNERFWKKLGETLRAALELVREMAEREGIDLDSLEMEEVAREERLRDQLAGNHRCSRAAKLYAEMVDDWFESVADLLRLGEGHSPLGDWLEPFDAAHSDQSPGVRDAVEVVRWYQHQICVKLMRALRGALEERDEMQDEFPRDSDGSAKVSLIGIDRSIAAWQEIRQGIPLGADGALDILIFLRRLRRAVEKEFPHARTFIRPGFDRIDLNA
jgi:hypothetical protein